MTEAKKFDPLFATLLMAASGIASYSLGELFVKRYQSLSPEEQAWWDANRIMHHGTLGVLMTGAGIFLLSPTLSPVLVGSGVGLVLSDRNDMP